ncbi:glucodextranase DOMON-like domain-containing protein [Dictyobacter arantiisoli]|uniref:Glucan 1,4-alpha-glucosidase n=1 Tax=Dictyobacter arantiisoli TaxID=2014874 RepID=A0A5A5TB50_9CHLR|nr:glucodextranase DOMON-like domain-containing protein [Dictyobacter arantiisoli]GCF08711.1 glucan 1,4-alpha-glucosidase [Dictyobacter arantiisoli]
MLQDGNDAFSQQFTRRQLYWYVLLALMIVLLPVGRWIIDTGQVGAMKTAAAAGGPGALAYFDLARKDCLGTAQNTSSKVWYTVADGVLSDVYYPTIDTTNVKTLQFVVTDGRSFTDLQTRDMTYTVKELNGPELACEVTSTAKSGKYRIVTDYVTDPHHNTVVLNIRFTPLTGTVSDYKLYIRYDATINGNGGGGTGNGGADNAAIDTSQGRSIPISYDTNTKTNAANRDYAQPVYSALDASLPFKQASSGFVDTSSDGLQQLDTSHMLTTLTSDAIDGNVVQTTQADLSHKGDLTLALGFGETQTAAVQSVRGSLNSSFATILAQYTAGWLRYDTQLKIPHPQAAEVTQSHIDPGKLLQEYYLNANVIKASEDKTFAGAIVASLASPWGQAISAGDPNNTYFGSYREIFARDLYETWTALYLDGDLSTARDAVNFLFYHQQQADGSMPRNSLLNGKTAPDSFNTQLDEASYPIIMAYQMGMTDATLYKNHIKAAANFVISHGPSYGVERWEEQGGYSPSTIAAEIAGLVAAADIAQKNHDLPSATVWRGVADDWQRSLKSWTVTDNGPLSKQPYFIRLSKTGDPNIANPYNLGNGGPTLDQRSVIDAGFLELVRLGELSPQDADIANSLAVVDKTIKVQTASGAGWDRYNGDGYGDGANDGHPWAPGGKGAGHIWPALSAERGEYQLANGATGTALSLLASMQQLSGGVGLIPEQDWDSANLAPSAYGTDPTTASIGFQIGKPDGSANPLTWSTASYVRLFNDIATQKIGEQPDDTYQRYVAHKTSQARLTITSPAQNSAVSASPITVTGTGTAGDTIVISATNTDQQSQTSTAMIKVASNGTFKTSIPVTGGNTVLNTVALSPQGATAHDQRTIYYDYTAGTLLFESHDPGNDDYGPGNYAYPTAADFHAGAYDIQDFRVYDTGDTIVFKLQTRDLTPTFGSALGAQLIDVYVHNPNAAVLSTAAAYPQRNYTLAQSAAWSQLLEVEGFGQRYIDGQGKTLGNITISANAISRTITFSVPKAILGTPTSSWGFTVTLTGQDGYSPDQARAFTTTPGAYSFGICQTANNDPHCTVDPTTVPKIMDTLTPNGVSQSDELDYTKHTVVLQAVTIP